MIKRVILSIGGQRDGVTLLAVFLILSVLGFITVTSMVVFSTNAFKIGVEGGVSVRATALNRACAEKALYVLREDFSYTGTGSVTLDNELCTYSVVDDGNSGRIITTTSTIDGLVRVEEVYVYVAFPSGNIVVTSWREKL